MLLDTQVVIWLLEDNPRLGASARDRVTSAPIVHVSAASIWEVAIKVDLGQLVAPDQLPARIEQAGLKSLPITPEHAWEVRATSGLPHRDPFDRLLVTQARVEREPLLTADRILLTAEVDGLETIDARH